MAARRLELGPLLALLGSLVLLVSLFLEWYRPGVSAWEVFEVLDLVLAALAVTGIAAALTAAGATLPGAEPGWLPLVAGAAFVLVVATLLNDPPAAVGADLDVGIWLAVTGSALMGAGALLSTARVSVSFDVQARRERVAAVDARRPGEPSTPAPAPGTAPAETAEPTEPGEPREPWRPAEDEDTTKAMPPENRPSS